LVLTVTKAIHPVILPSCSLKSWAPTTGQESFLSFEMKLCTITGERILGEKLAHFDFQNY
jgi:hypothetical protein